MAQKHCHKKKKKSRLQITGVNWGKTPMCGHCCIALDVENVSQICFGFGHTHIHTQCDSSSSFFDRLADKPSDTKPSRTGRPVIELSSQVLTRCPRTTAPACVHLRLREEVPDSTRLLTRTHSCLSIKRWPAVNERGSWWANSNYQPGYHKSITRCCKTAVAISHT